MTEHNQHPTPAVLPAAVLKKDPAKRRGRGFALGERNPDTLPGSGKNAESVHQNDQRTRELRTVRKWAQSAGSIGFKY